MFFTKRTTILSITYYKIVIQILLVANIFRKRILFIDPILLFYFHFLFPTFNCSPPTFQHDLIQSWLWLKMTKIFFYFTFLYLLCDPVLLDFALYLPIWFLQILLSIEAILNTQGEYKFFISQSQRHILHRMYASRASNCKKILENSIAIVVEENAAGKQKHSDCWLGRKTMHSNRNRVYRNNECDAE